MGWFRRRTPDQERIRDLAIKLGRANEQNNRNAATIRTLNGIIQRGLRTQADVERLTQERDNALRQAADLAAVNVIAGDARRVAEASLSGTREQLRQVQVEHARAQEELAEARVTIDGLGLKLAGYERAEAIADETRAKRYFDGLADE